MTKACSICGDDLIHLAPGVYVCFRDDLAALMPVYIEVKGPQQ